MAGIRAVVAGPASEHGECLWRWLQKPRMGAFTSAVRAFENRKEKRLFASFAFHPIKLVIRDQHFEWIFLQMLAMGTVKNKGHAFFPKDSLSLRTDQNASHAIKFIGFDM
jgi:hypothetical protein